MRLRARRADRRAGPGRRRVGALAAVLVLATASCGDDDGDGVPQFSGEGGEAFCERTAALPEAFGDEPIVDDALSPEDQAARLDLAVSLVDEVSAVAPDEIADTVRELEAGLRSLRERVVADQVDAPGDEHAVAGDLARAGEETVAAFERLAHYFDQVCPEFEQQARGEPRG